MPLVGIFWFHQQTILAKTCKITEGIQGVHGLIDSPFDHWKIWEEMPKPSALWELEYHQLPRGRVIYDVNQKKARVYLDKNLAKETLKEIIRSHFQLSNYTICWLLDSHYTTDSSKLYRLFLQD